ERRRVGSKAKEISYQAAGDRGSRQLLHWWRAEGHQLRDGAWGESNGGSQPDYDRTDVRAVRDSANQEGAHAAGDHGARVVAHGGVPGVNAGRTGRLVSLFRAEGHLGVSGGSSGTWTIGLR